MPETEAYDDEYKEQQNVHYVPNNHQQQQQLNETAGNYIRDCLSEKSKLEPNFPIAMKLIDSEILQVHATGKISSKEQYADIYKQKTIKVCQKIYVPTKEFPKFNFVGRLLGPGGNSLRRLQEETQCRILILGRNSMRDRNKEEELRISADPKYAHLNMHLHVEISCIAPPAEAYANVAYALTELRKYLTPDVHDDIHHEQWNEAHDDGEKHRPKYPQNHEVHQPAGHSSKHYRREERYESRAYTPSYRPGPPAGPSREHHRGHHLKPETRSPYGNFAARGSPRFRAAPYTSHTYN